MSVLKMSVRERRRVEVLGRVRRGELTLRKAADLMELSYRQALRGVAVPRQLA